MGKRRGVRMKHEMSYKPDLAKRYICSCGRKYKTYSSAVGHLMDCVKTLPDGSPTGGGRWVNCPSLEEIFKE